MTNQHPEVTTTLAELDGSDVFHRDYPPEKKMGIKFVVQHVPATLHLCAVEEFHHVVPAESVDVILTDPPYPKEYLPTWEALGHFAAHALKPSGHLLAMSGQAWLPQVFELLGRAKGIRYQWALVYPIPPSGVGGNLKGTSIGRRIPQIMWKPILWYIKPPSDIHQQLSDMLPADTGHDKRYHVWGQAGAPLRWLLAQLKKGEGDIVCDPFVGGGTSAIAAIEEGCNFVGCDVDLDAIRTSLARLNELQLELPVVSDIQVSPPVIEQQEIPLE